MTKRIISHAAAAVVLSAAALTLGGCMNPTSTGDPEQQSAEYGRLMEAEAPGLARAAGWDSLGSLTEKSCLGTADPAEASRETRWTAVTGEFGTSETEAGRVAEQVRQAAEDTGWTSKEGSGAHGDRLYGAVKGDLNLTVTYRTGAGEAELSLRLDSPCLEMPEGHTMARSELDPMYGSSDPLYPNDDRSKFTNGEPQPLPEPSES
ncbi:hypothetical protein [Microbacterium sp. A93]|uniref:hypothetical protein n=1 Tax=Microbacterium sp. A93 TaxID=3450716 RepID=UPI003F444F20